MVFTIASVGLPSTSGFVGEFLVIAGVFQDNTWVAALAATGLILSAAYMLYLYRRVIFGRLEKDDLKAMMDLNWREVGILAPLVVLVFWMGIYPSSFLDLIQPSVANIVENTNASLEEAAFSASNIATAVTTGAY